ncbi:MAG: VOC family protein [Chloroflexi bacterium]|nr:VOC family protein [Chloroflexota bacterium]
MTVTVQPFLMFEGNADEAMKLYVSAIPDSAILHVERYDAATPEAQGKVVRGVFSLAGQTVLCTDSPIEHDFTFTPASSLFVTCDSAQQLDDLAALLSADGKVLMPPDDYGFSPRFTWIADRFGVSWQLSLEPTPDGEAVAREFIAAFARHDMDALRALLADDVRAHITNAEGGEDALTGADAYLARVAAMDIGAAQLTVTPGQVTTIAPGRVLAMVDVHAHRQQRCLENYAAHLLEIENGRISEMWMVDAKPAESADFWSTGRP